MEPSTVSLAGKVALVTGAGVGMGAATARILAARGAKVIVSDFVDDTGEATAQAIRDEGAEAQFFHCDVADEAEVKALIEACVECFGRLDCAVNNAAITPDTDPITETDMDRFDRIMAVNLRGVMLCMKYELRQMVAQGNPGCAIVNIASVSAVRPQPNNPAYIASKHGVIGLTKSGSLDYAPLGIRVNAVIPGAIDTPMLRGAMQSTGVTEADFAPALSLLGRFGQPEEVAEASAWLCSDAASYVTGHALAVEAGYLTR